MEHKNPQLWPGWDTVRVLGHGSFGAVYEVERDLFGEKERAALKTLSIPQNRSEIEEMYAEGYDDASITQTFHTYLQGIVAEYKLMHQLDNCVNVVHSRDVKYFPHEDGLGWDVYILMELLTPLVKAIPMAPEDATVIRLGMDLCNALSRCRALNILHRDIKPANIFVSPEGYFKLGDFGIAKTAEATMSGTKAGTYDYMAPEVYYGQPYGHAADIYSLGLVMYWLLNERHGPFLTPPAPPTATEKANARERRFNGDRLPAPAHGSPELQRIVLKACAFDPAVRYASADALRADLSALAGAAPAPAVVPVGTQPAPAEEEGTVRIPNAPAPEEPATILQNTPSAAEETGTVVIPALKNTAETQTVCREKAPGPVPGPTGAEDEPVAHFPAAEPEATQGTTPKTAPKEPIKKKKTPLLVAILAAAAVLVAVLCVVLFGGKPKLQVTVPPDGQPNYMMESSGNLALIWGQEKYKREDVTSIRFTSSIDDIPSGAWDISYARDCSIVAWLDKAGTLTIASAKTISAPPRAGALFAGFSNATAIDFNGCFETSAANSMVKMFYGCKSLTAIDLSFFDTTGVENMGFMFAECHSLTAIDLSRFDTSGAENMTGMFSGCWALTALDFSTFDTSRVQNMSLMFSNCTGLQTLDLSGFNTAAVTDMSNMFSCCSSLTELDLSAFDTSSVTNMSNMFFYLKSIRELNLSSFDTSSVTNMEKMFSYHLPDTFEPDVSGFDVSNVTEYEDFMDEGRTINGRPWIELFDR